MSKTSDPRARAADIIRQRRKTHKKPGEKAQARMRVVLDVLRSDPKATINVATSHAGVQPETHKQWRKRDKDYAAAVDRIYARRKGKYTPPRVSFTPEFREKYFGHTYPVKPVNPKHLIVMADFIETIKPGETGLILVPPDHAKSSMVEDKLGQVLADDPNARCSIVSKAEDAAIRRLVRIRLRMEDFDIYGDYVDDFGPFKTEMRTSGKPWGDKRFTVARATSGERDYSLQALGVRGQIQGARQEWIVLDDIADEFNQSPNEVLKQEEWIRKIVVSRIGDYGRIVGIGTRVSETDIYRKLMDEDFFDRILILPAQFEETFVYEMRDGSEIVFERGSYLWPERFPDVSYDKFKKRAGPRIWDLQFLQKDSTSEGSWFPRKLLEGCFRDDAAVGEIPDGAIRIGAVDPSASKNTAGVCFAVNPKSFIRRWVDVWNEYGLIGEGGDITEGLVEWIIEFVRTYQIQYLGLEQNSAFVLLSTSNKLKVELTRLGCEMVTLESTGTGLSHAGEEVKDLNIKMLSPIFANRVVEIPNKGPETQAVFEIAIRQFERWRPRDRKVVKDIIKAFQMAEAVARLKVDEEDAGDYETEGLDNLPPYLQNQNLPPYLQESMAG